MKPRSTRDIRAALKRKGFEEDLNHHHYFWLLVDGKRTLIRTRYSHGAQECDCWIQQRMAEQLHLKPKEFEDLINCPLGHATLVEILIKRGEIRKA